METEIMHKRVTLFALLAPLTIALAAPEIAMITEPACNGEIVVITGEGFVPGKTVVKAACLGAYDAKLPQDPLTLLDAIGHAPELPATPPAAARDCKLLGSGEGFLQAEFHCLPQPWIRAPFTSAVWVGDGTSWSRPYLVNRPQAQWLYPQTQAPGEPVRVFGRTFSWSYHLPPALAVIRPIGSTNAVPLRVAAQHHEDGNTERWALCAWLPPDLAPGNYELLVHGRHGGAHGWSDPLTLTVAAKPAARRTINARDLGAKGDGLSDDTAALEAAFRQAASGGTLLLPTGTYAVTKMLEIPDGLALQGAGMHQTIIANLQTPSVESRTLTETRPAFAGRDLLHGMSNFTLRDLTLRFMPASGSALCVGKDPLWSDNVSLYRVRLETQQDFGLAKDHGYCARPLNIVKARRFSMVRCETVGPGGCSCERKVEDSLFSQNLFQTDRNWRGHGFKFWGAEHVIFEDNRLAGDTRGLVLQTHFGVNYQNFIAGNTVERTVLGGNAGETYLVEGSGYLYESRVETATDTSLKTERWPKVRSKDATAADCIGRFAVIARGRGLGQWRRITACDPAAHELRLDKPWRVTPDATSVAVVMNGLIDTVFVNNQEIDCGKGLYLYGAGAINCVVDRHLCDRTLGVTLMTDDDRQSADPAERTTAPDFFNLIRDCRIHGGGGLVCGAGGRLPLQEERDAPLANFANRFVENEVQNVTPFSGTQYGANWTWGGGWDNVMAGISVIPMDLGVKPGGGTNGPARITANVFLNNWVSASRIGVGISQRASDTLLHHTALYDVAVPIVDHGRATQNLEAHLRTDEDYTPERSPIR
jgi:hypothetical protein